VIEAGLKRGRLSVVADQQQRPEPRAIACQFGQHRAGIIGRTVVDQDQLEGPLRGSQRGLDPVDQLPQISALVEDRNHDRHQRQRSGAAGGPRTGHPCGFSGGTGLPRSTLAIVIVCSCLASDLIQGSDKYPPVMIGEPAARDRAGKIGSRR